MPAEYHGNHFFCDNAQNLDPPLPAEAATAPATRSGGPRDEKVEFLASTEQWFRPVNLHERPRRRAVHRRHVPRDHRGLLGHPPVPAAAVRGVADRRRRSRTDLAPRGRRRRQPRKFDLTRPRRPNWSSELSNTNAWWRQTAQRLLVERGDKTGRRAACDLVRDGNTPQARLHALYTLDGLGVSAARRLVEHALGDPHFAVRMHALRLAEPLAGRPRRLWPEKSSQMVDDADRRGPPPARLHAGPERGPAGRADAGRSWPPGTAATPWMADAILSSVADSADRLLRAILPPRRLGEARPLAPPAGLGRRRPARRRRKSATC